MKSHKLYRLECEPLTVKIVLLASVMEKKQWKLGMLFVDYVELNHW